MDEDFSIGEFAEMYGVSQSYLYKLWRENRGPPRKITKVGQRHRAHIPRDGGMIWLAVRKPFRAEALGLVIENCQYVDGEEVA